jgi:uncharacterized membrane protein
MVITILLAALLLGEVLTVKSVIGILLLTAGTLVMVL